MRNREASILEALGGKVVYFQEQNASIRSHASCCQTPVNGTAMSEGEHRQPSRAPHLGPGTAFNWPSTDDIQLLPAPTGSDIHLLPAPELAGDAQGTAKISPAKKKKAKKISALQAQKCKMK